MFQATLNKSTESGLLMGNLEDITSHRYPGETLPPLIQAEQLPFIYIDTEVL